MNMRHALSLLRTTLSFVCSAVLIGCGGGGDAPEDPVARSSGLPPIKHMEPRYGVCAAVSAKEFDSVFSEKLTLGTNLDFGRHCYLIGEKTVLAVFGNHTGESSEGFAAIHSAGWEKGWESVAAEIAVAYTDAYWSETTQKLEMRVTDVNPLNSARNAVFVTIHDGSPSGPRVKKAQILAIGALIAQGISACEAPLTRTEDGYCV
jgi:hypothetical protein